MFECDDCGQKNYVYKNDDKWVCKTCLNIAMADPNWKPEARSKPTDDGSCSACDG